MQNGMETKNITYEDLLDMTKDYKQGCNIVFGIYSNCIKEISIS